MLGQTVLNLFDKNKYEIVLSSFEDYSYSNDFDYFKVNIGEKQEVKKLLLDFYPDCVINLAAYTNVDKCETERNECWKVNVDAIEYFAKYCVPTNSHLIHISSDYVFDGKNGPYNEKELPNPISYYGRSKLAGENILKKFDIKVGVFKS